MKGGNLLYNSVHGVHLDQNHASMLWNHKEPMIYRNLYGLSDLPILWVTKIETQESERTCPISHISERQSLDRNPVS